jgi:hypothetical protein
VIPLPGTFQSRNLQRKGWKLNAPKEPMESKATKPGRMNDPVMTGGID